MIEIFPASGKDGYAPLLSELKQRIRTARLRAALSVNEELILLYWSIGRDILNRQSDPGWGVLASLIGWLLTCAATSRR
ncbi:DUF1016 N-terminal domain-containing protein [Mesorhizobium sp. CO1-1-8]|uniref:DUF1016 N-terminal domain-containing protein n=1 Tax=Mesorhizobium sp. CO1-1-8 TaxID=2876631 RepID=UPI0021E266AE|nr:DUF1016 N-terminal domain-containing protein [Mesorhizobium sp. CO1-1-8]